MSTSENIQVPTGPLDDAPRIELPGMSSIESARAMWRHALRGLPLGDYDRRMAAWAWSVMDQPQLIAFASLIERARSATVPQSGDAVEAWMTDWIEDFKDTPTAANAIRAMRGHYRAHALHGTPLGQDIPAPPPAAAREALAARVQPVADAQQDRDDRDGGQ